MTEVEAIERVDEPVTTATIKGDLRELGVSAGETLLVHTSLSALGWVCGGAPAVVDALQEVLTESGTLVMPTHSTQYSDPAVWESPPVPEDWVPTIRKTRPPYRPAVTPTRGMGAVAECFRSYPGVVRSRHPEVSFAAWGSNAEAVTADHAYDLGLGEGSPLARVYDRDGRVLLLGVGHGQNTSLHLAEHRADLDLGTGTTSVPVVRNGEAVRVEYETAETDASDFDACGAAFEATAGSVEGRVGAASAKLMAQRALVDFGAGWLEANR